MNNIKNNVVKNLMTIFLPLLIFIIIDAFFIFQYTKGTGFSFIIAVIISAMVAIILDSFSFCVSYFGIVDLFAIPKIKKIPKIKSDRTRALIVALIMGIAIVVGQTALIYLRYGQIKEKDMQYELEKVRYESRIQVIDANEELDTIEREKAKNTVRRARYDGNRTLDFLSMLIPAFTSLLSFVIGLIIPKRYVRFENEKIALMIEREEILNQRNKELAEYEEKINILIGIVEKEYLGTNISYEELSSKKKEIINNIEENLKKGVPIKYENCNESLPSIVDECLGNIKHKFSEYANNPTLFLEFPFRDQHKDKFDILEKLDDKIMKI